MILGSKSRKNHITGTKVLGVTEFFLRLMAWLCTSIDNDTMCEFRKSQMCIVTGPNIDITTKLIKRMKQIFERKLSVSHCKTIIMIFREIGILRSGRYSSQNTDTPPLQLWTIYCRCLLSRPSLRNKDYIELL